MTAKQTFWGGCAVCLSLPAFAAADTVVLQSTLPIYEVTAPDTIPAPPEGRLQDCRPVPVTTAAGRAVQAAGWQVVAEIGLGGKDIVTFAGSSQPDSYGVCAYADSNLALFDGERIIGLVRSADAEDNTFGPLFVEEGGAVVLYGSSFPLLAVAQLVHNNGTFTLQAAAPLLDACEGRVTVPRPSADTIGAFRESLIALDWTPATPAAADVVAGEMQARGFPETESCSAAPPYYCSYYYNHPQAALHVTSVGEMIDEVQPVVADYAITCQE